MKATFLNFTVMKATFRSSQGMKVAFLSAGVMKVAFLNLDGRSIPTMWEYFLGMWMDA